jgi:two-component system OmpR family sensor kinase
MPVQAKRSTSREAERRRITSSEVAEFVATAAHELRTPLTILTGMSERLEKRRDMSDAEIGDAVAMLTRQSRRMKQLIENLLDLGQLESGHRPHHDPVALSQVVADALELIPPPDVTTVSLLDLSPGVSAWGDRMDLGRVLVNLLSNAYRYGGPHVTVELSTDRREAVLAVSDDGPGLPPELIDRVFKPFTRGIPARGSWGSGLGLALSLRLVESVGGTLTYVPSDRGSRFEMRLDLAS